MATIRIPTPLRPYSEGKNNVSVSGRTVAEALEDLTRQHPDLRKHLFEGDELRSFVNIYLNQEDIRYLDGTSTTISSPQTDASLIQSDDPAACNLYDKKLDESDLFKTHISDTDILISLHEIESAESHTLMIIPTIAGG